jgi:hypothetical protein
VLPPTVPELSEMRPLERSAVVNPANVTEAVGSPGALACSVRTCEARGTLTVLEGKVEILGRDAPDSYSIAGMEVDNSAPGNRQGATIIGKECICPAAADKEVRSRAAVQHVGAATDCDCVVATTCVDKP